MSPRKRSAPAGDTLAGRFFLTRRDGNAQQGVVLGRLGDGCWLAQLFSWLDGEPSSQVVFATVTTAVEGWSFYEDREAWLDAGRRVTSRNLDRAAFERSGTRPVSEGE